MISALALTTLALAVGSEEPAEPEEDWSEQFSQIDFLRNLWGIPPLTSEERMRLILGQDPVLRARSLVTRELAEKLYVVWEPGDSHNGYR